MLRGMEERMGKKRGWLKFQPSTAIVMTATMGSMLGKNAQCSASCLNCSAWMSVGG